MTAFILTGFSRMTRRIVILFGLTLIMTVAACDGGAVQFAPIIQPLEDALTRYTHPSGVFTLAMPRGWAVYEQNTSSLVSAAFSAPMSDVPTLVFAVINLDETVDDLAFVTLIDRYQTQIRPDSADYTETARIQVSGDVWRLSGIRRAANEETLNTFIGRTGTQLYLIEHIIDANTDLALSEQIVNSFRVGTSALVPSTLDSLAFAKSSRLAVLHSSAWVASDGALFVTGEIANYGTTPITDLPVEVSILSANGIVLGGAVDQPLGYGIEPGGFAPFSLRFGEGQAPDAATYTVRIGGDGWTPDEPFVFSSSSELTWTDSSTFDARGNLLITGEVSNTGSRALRAIRARVTVFDAGGRVIGAAVSDVTPSVLAPAASGVYELLLTALGGTAQNFIVDVQGVP